MRKENFIEKKMAASRIQRNRAKVSPGIRPGP